jgi:hypothetical protein
MGAQRVSKIDLPSTARSARSKRIGLFDTRPWMESIPITLSLWADDTQDSWCCPLSAADRTRYTQNITGHIRLQISVVWKTSRFTLARVRAPNRLHLDNSNLQTNLDAVPLFPEILPHYLARYASATVRVRPTFQYALLTIAPWKVPRTLRYSEK